MRRNLAPSFSPLLLIAFVAAGCASAPPINMDEPRRVVGTQSAVRVDAEIRGEEVRSGTALPLTYEITNQRDQTIAVADVIPIASYDGETHTITIDVGSEVPGQSTLPRLVTIAPGEKKSFSTNARLNFVVQPRTTGAETRQPASLRLKVNFLRDTEPFRELLNIPERVVANAALADALFPLWLERNEVVYTNSVPMRLSSRDAMTPLSRPAPTGPTRRRP